MRGTINPTQAALNAFEGFAPKEALSVVRHALRAATDGEYTYNAPTPSHNNLYNKLLDFCPVEKLKELEADLIKYVPLEKGATILAFTAGAVILLGATYGVQKLRQKMDTQNKVSFAENITKERATSAQIQASI